MRDKTMNHLPYSALAVCSLLLVSACGHTAGDRAVSGAGIGAGVGAVGGAIMGGNAATGAVVGGAVGAAAGGLTKEKDVNLGKPIWR
jgi:osmotically inducible lipoprotein OsmB